VAPAALLLRPQVVLLPLWCACCVDQQHLFLGVFTIYV
jgi:hypothetical protein